MTMEMVADPMFGAGDEAPRGTYLCMASGLVHRLARPAALPQGGPFRMIAPTHVLGATPPPTVTAQRWPEEEVRRTHEPDESWMRHYAMVRIFRGNWW
jgi:hypothetical protein